MSSHSRMSDRKQEKFRRHVYGPGAVPTKDAEDRNGSESESRSPPYNPLKVPRYVPSDEETETKPPVARHYRRSLTRSSSRTRESSVHSESDSSEPGRIAPRPRPGRSRSLTRSANRMARSLSANKQPTMEANPSEASTDKLVASASEEVVSAVVVESPARDRSNSEDLKTTPIRSKESPSRFRPVSSRSPFSKLLAEKKANRSLKKKPLVPKPAEVSSDEDAVNTSMLSQENVEKHTGTDEYADPPLQELESEVTVNTDLAIERYVNQTSLLAKLGTSPVHEDKPKDSEEKKETDEDDAIPAALKAWDMANPEFANFTPSQDEEFQAAEFDKGVWASASKESKPQDEPNTENTDMDINAERNFVQMMTEETKFRTLTEEESKLVFEANAKIAKFEEQQKEALAKPTKDDEPLLVSKSGEETATGPSLEERVKMYAAKDTDSDSSSSESSASDSDSSEEEQVGYVDQINAEDSEDEIPAIKGSGSAEEPIDLVDQQFVPTFKMAAAAANFIPKTLAELKLMGPPPPPPPPGKPTKKNKKKKKQKKTTKITITRSSSTTSEEKKKIPLIPPPSEEKLKNWRSAQLSAQDYVSAMAEKLADTATKTLDISTEYFKSFSNEEEEEEAQPDKEEAEESVEAIEYTVDDLEKVKSGEEELNEEEPTMKVEEAEEETNKPELVEQDDVDETPAATTDNVEEEVDVEEKVETADDDIEKETVDENVEETVDIMEKEVVDETPKETTENVETEPTQDAADVIEKECVDEQPQETTDDTPQDTVVVEEMVDIEPEEATGEVVDATNAEEADVEEENIDDTPNDEPASPKEESVEAEASVDQLEEEICEELGEETNENEGEKEDEAPVLEMKESEPSEEKDLNVEILSPSEGVPASMFTSPKAPKTDGFSEETTAKITLTDSKIADKVAMASSTAANTFEQALSPRNDTTPTEPSHDDDEEPETAVADEEPDFGKRSIVPEGHPSPFESTISEAPRVVAAVLSFLGDPVAISTMKKVNKECLRIVSENEHTLMQDAVRSGGLAPKHRAAFWIHVALERGDTGNLVSKFNSVEELQALVQSAEDEKWHHVIQRDVDRSFGNMPPHKMGATCQSDSIVEALVTWGQSRLMKRGVKGGGEAVPMPEIEGQKEKVHSPAASVSSPPWIEEDDIPIETGSQDEADVPMENIALCGNSLSPEEKADLQKKLSFILHTLAATYEDIGYCQGMDYVVAHLLRNLENTIRAKAAKKEMPAILATTSALTATKDLVMLNQEIDANNVIEETVVRMMDTFFVNYNLKHMYWPELRCLKTCCRVFERLIQIKLPVLADHFEHHDLNVGLFALGWFQTLFLYLPSMPSATVDHIWDIWLVERSFKIFFRVGTAILFLSQPTLLNYELEGMMTYLNTIPDATLLRPDILIPCALNIKVTNRLLQELEEEVMKSPN